MRDENLPVLMFLILLYRKVKWKLFYNEKRCLCWGFDDKFYNAFFYVVFLVFHRLCPALVVIVSCFAIGYKLMVLKWEREGERKETRDEIFFTKLNPTTFEGIKRWATFFYIFLKKDRCIQNAWSEKNHWLFYPWIPPLDWIGSKLCVWRLRVSYALLIKLETISEL